jgi:GTP-binding protein Era
MKFKSGFVSLVGRPNVGKSTLLNVLAKEKIAITSSKPQTTRNVIRAIVTDDESQTIFIDTPGIHRPKTRLGEYMVNVAVETIGDVDLLLLVTDISNPRSQKEDLDIIQKLQNIRIPIILVVNKVDEVAKENLLPFIKHYSEQLEFQAIIPVSALKKEGIELLFKEIKRFLIPGPKFFPEDMITDQPERVIVSEIVREKLLRLLNEEIPHGIGVDIVSFKEREDKEIIDIQANIYCEKDSHKAIIIGKQGKMLKKVGSQARNDIERFLDTKVFLELWVKVKEDWRNSNFVLNSLGYKK